MNEPEDLDELYGKPVQLRDIDLDVEIYLDNYPPEEDDPFWEKE